tara:strand:+ start:1969 stop:3030 length:1062 start_codon:yes stop_codon:yes gene_type:complete
MFIERLSIKNLRNIPQADLLLNKKTNVIIGENAAGKTTVLEAVDILSRGKSFRTNKTESLVKNNQQELYIGAIAGEKRKKLEIYKSKSKTKIVIDGKEEKRQSALAEGLAVQAIHPNSHFIIEGAPIERRAFIDWGLFHVEHQFREEFLRYNKTLRQRNEALKAKDKNQAKWMEELAFLGEKITTMRENYLSALTPHFANSKEFIMPDHDLLFEYDRGWEKGKSLLAALQDKEDIDFDRGYTSRGPQNADLRILLNNQEAYKICSRGQQKLIANIMLLSQSKGFFEVKKFPSIILVDDLSAELTLEMQEKILERLFETNSQIFLTALNDSVLAEILNEMEAGVFHVEHGEIAQ